MLFSSKIHGKTRFSMLSSIKGKAAESVSSKEQNLTHMKKIQIEVKKENYIQLKTLSDGLVEKLNT